MKKHLLAMGLSLLAIVAWAQEENQFAIDAQLRTRGEYNNGAGNPRYQSQLPATFINERARVSMDYERGGMLELKLSAQHTGLWGQDGMNTSNGRMTMNEAWAKLMPTKEWFVKIGRQQLVYDDERLLGSSDWDADGNWHDALKVATKRIIKNCTCLLLLTVTILIAVITIMVICLIRPYRVHGTITTLRKRH